MKIWRFIKDKLEKDISVVLLYVLDSKGSSPGRQGFKMAVANDREILGTIGGGILRANAGRAINNGHSSRN